MATRSLQEKMSSAERTMTSRKKPTYVHIDGVCVPKSFQEHLFKSALTYKPDPDDIFIVTFPKCGTNWTVSITEAILKVTSPDPSSAEKKTSSLNFLEMVGKDSIEKLPRPRVIQTHLSPNHLPYSPEAKYIFVLRNPKDCCVSFYHHTKAIPAYEFQDGTFDEFFQLFLEGETDFGDYFDFILQWYERRRLKNVLILTYESMIKERRSAVLKIAKFLGDNIHANLIENEDKIDHILEETSMHSMRGKVMERFFGRAESRPDPSDPLVKVFTDENGIYRPPPPVAFVRKGEIGDWKNYFSESQSLRLEAKFKEKARNSDIKDLWKDVQWMISED